MLTDAECACVDSSAYECWRRRYHLFPSEDVEEDGGPCGCPCHDAFAMESAECRLSAR